METARMTSVSWFKRTEPVRGAKSQQHFQYSRGNESLWIESRIQVNRRLALMLFNWSLILRFIMFKSILISFLFFFFSKNSFQLPYQVSMRVCVAVWVCARVLSEASDRKRQQATHTHTHSLRHTYTHTHYIIYNEVRAGSARGNSSSVGHKSCLPFAEGRRGGKEAWLIVLCLLLL